MSGGKKEFGLTWNLNLISRWQSQKDVHSYSPARTPKLQITAEQPPQECGIPLKKDTYHPRAREKPQQDSWRSEIAFRIKPHTHQRCLEGSNKTLGAPEPRDPTKNWMRPAFECPRVPVGAQVSSGLPWGQGQGLWQTWEHGVWHKSSWRSSPLAPL